MKKIHLSMRDYAYEPDQMGLDLSVEKAQRLIRDLAIAVHHAVYENDYKSAPLSGPDDHIHGNTELWLEVS